MAEFTPNQRVPGLFAAYTVERKLGEGGFGVVHLARDDGGRRAVLKQLQVARMGDWKAMELFEREARVLASLDHPNIPRCREFFATDGVRAAQVEGLSGTPTLRIEEASLVLVQDHVEGASLQARIEAGERVGAAEATRLLEALLRVLEYLHGLHPPVVHRDIKPANIVVTPAGEPMLVDFGASQERLRRESELGTTSVGTFGYFPIEQVLGKARPASDLYALAMTMMVVLTHRPPEDLPLDPRTSKVRVAEAAPHLPAALARVLDAMLEPAALARVLDAMLEPAIGERVAGASEALRALAGGALVPAAAAPSAVAPAATMPALEWRLPLWGGVLAAACIYLVFFNEFSEEELVQVSFLWAPLVAFGLGGLWTGARRTALTWALLTGVGLVVFFELVFPSM